MVVSCEKTVVPESINKKKTTKYLISRFKTLKVIKRVRYFVVSWYNYKKINK